MNNEPKTVAQFGYGGLEFDVVESGLSKSLKLYVTEDGHRQYVDTLDSGIDVVETAITYTRQA